MFQSFLIILFGILTGCLTGLTPGVHVNTIISFIELIPFNSFNSAIFFVCIAVVHSFLEFIPASILGIPSSSNYSIILPLHKFSIRGKAFQGIKLTALGGLFGTIWAIILLPIYIALISFINQLTLVIPFFLFSILFLSIISEKSFSKIFKALLIIFLSSLIGLITFYNIIKVENSLFVIITSIFGLSSLFYSLNEKNTFLNQKFENEKINFPLTIGSAFLSAIASLLVSLFPGIGPAHAIFILESIGISLKMDEYLIIVGGIGTTNIIFSLFLVLFTSKTRTGVAVALKELIELNLQNVLVFLFLIIFLIFISYFLTILLAEKFIKIINKIPIFTLNILVILLICFLIIYFSGFNGILISILATFIGLLTLKFEVKKSHTMAFLIIPTILHYLFV